MNTAIYIPEKVINILEKEARKRGLSLPEFLINSIAENLDPITRVEVYIELHRKYLEETKKLSDKGNLEQAGEKYWGPITALLNAMGEKEKTATLFI